MHKKKRANVPDTNCDLGVDGFFTDLTDADAARSIFSRIARSNRFGVAVADFLDFFFFFGVTRGVAAAELCDGVSVADPLALYLGYRTQEFRREPSNNEAIAASESPLLRTSADSTRASSSKPISAASPTARGRSAIMITRQSS
jgi:hypothetical protein